MLHVSRDDLRRRLVVRAEGEVSFAQLATFLETQLEQGAWDYAVLHDARQATTDLRPEDSRLLLTATQRTAQGRARGPVAVVTCDERVSEVVRLHAAMAREAGFRMAVFRDLESAEAWLEVSAARVGPPR